MTNMELITATTLSSSAASVTFSSIPQTYNDLMIRVSSRSSVSSTLATIGLRFNGGTSGYSDTYIYAFATTSVSSSRDTAQTSILIGQATANQTTANTFNSMEIYIPNYKSSASKPVSTFGVVENNSTALADWYISANAGLSTLSSAVTSIVILDTSGNFVSGSTFRLYGVSNT